MTPARRSFGTTWWGRAWIDALEQRARLDPNRLPRGRTYARQNRVGTLVVTPGQIAAPVQGSRPRPYRVAIRVRPFTDREWHLVTDAIVGRAAHAAALLDGEMRPELLEEVRAAGVDLFAGPGELGPTCSCPDWADPCKHAAAVCYLMADVLDADPFELFHLRGRPRDQLLAAVRDRRRELAGPATRGSSSPDTAGASTSSRRRRAGTTPTGVAARTAYARPQPSAADLWALPGPPPVAHAGHPAPLAVSPPARSGIEADDLLSLASDAAARAWALDRGDADGGLSLTADRDLARRAAVLLGTRGFAALAERSGLPSRHLVRHALAWRHGGEEGIEVLTETWMPDADALEEGRAALAASASGSWRLADDTGPRPIKVRANTVMLGAVQLRLARSGRWYRFAKVAGHWEIEDGPVADPASLFADARAARPPA